MTQRYTPGTAADNRNLGAPDLIAAAVGARLTMNDRRWLETSRLLNIPRDTLKVADSDQHCIKDENAFRLQI
jgi:hypothetical protein